tara:strand:+ start:183 stop:359 length:177 start_codon:yes stop_codon:yes gene_type:complete
MKRNLITIYIFSSIFLISGCTYSEIETKANDAGNILGRVIRGVSDGLVEGFTGVEKRD